MLALHEKGSFGGQDDVWVVAVAEEAAVLYERQYFDGQYAAQLAMSGDIVLLTECVGDKTDDQIILSHSGIQYLFVHDVERDWLRKLHALGARLSAFESSACWKRSVVSERASRVWDLPTVTVTPDSERMSRVGLVTKPLMQ